jgi:CHAD domain-containing protein
MHEWRKRVKDLRYVAEALAPVYQDAAGRDARAKKAAEWLRGIGKRANRLGELLGEEHDLAVLGAWIEERSSSSVIRKQEVGKRTANELSRLIAKRRGKLRRQALREGERLYGQAGGKLKHRIRAARPSRLS